MGLAFADTQEPLTSICLQRYMQEHAIQAQLVPDAATPAEAVIKSLVFIADTEPILVVVMGCDKARQGCALGFGAWGKKLTAARWNPGGG